MLRRLTRVSEALAEDRASKADNWRKGRCFGVAAIKESVIAGDRFAVERGLARGRSRLWAYPTQILSRKANADTT